MALKKVMILGASRYYSRSIRAARNAGYHVLAVDREPNSEGFAEADSYAICDIIDKDKLLELADKEKISGVIPVNDYGVPSAAFLAERLGLPGISEKAAVLATNKEEMRKRWIQKGIPCPKFEVVFSSEELHNAVEKVGIPCILKPAHGIGGGSRGVIVIKDKRKIEECIRFSQNFYDDKATLVETFVESEYEHSAEVLINCGKANVIAISDKVKSPLPYRVDRSVIYPTSVSGALLDKLKKTIIESVLALDINIGAAHVEIASTRNGFVLFELGARCGGGGTPEPIVPYATGVDEFVELVRILCGDPPKNLTPICMRACIYHFITPSPGTIKEISGLDEIKKYPGVLDAELFVKKGSQIRKVAVGGDRAGFIITGAETREEAYNLALKLEKKLYIEYEKNQNTSRANCKSQKQSRLNKL